MAFSTLAFVACGDDDSSVKSVMDSDEVDELGECNSENEKDIKYVSSEDLYYKCVEGEWEEVDRKTDDKDDAKSSSSKKTVVSSSSKAKSSSSSVKKDSGKSSSSSKKEESAKSSSSSVNKNLADCGGKSYDKTEKFCKNKKIYDLCGGKEYDPSTEICKDKKVLTKCGEDSYDKTEKFCMDKKIYDLCGGEEYDLATEICKDKKVLTKCGEDSYDKTEKFCKDGSVYDLCGGEEYDLATEICKDKNVLTKCSDGSYDKATQFCKDGGVYDLCGGKEYSPVDEVCKEGIVASRYTFGYALKNAPRPSAGCGKNSSLVKTKTIENGERYEMMVEGLNREYFITLPKDYDKTKPYKLLFAMHSMGSNAEDFVHHYADQDHPSPYYGQQNLDTEGNYIFVALRGDTDGNVWRKNDGKDHAFFDKLLTTMEDNYCIDTSRVFVTGFALGALFTYSLAEEFQDRIRAIVTYAVADYNIYEPHENGMEKSLPIAWMNVHGKNDPSMLYEKAVESALPRVLKKNGKASDGDSQFTDASGETPAEVVEGETDHLCYDFTSVDERFPVKWCTWNGRSQWTAYDGASSSNGWKNTWVPKEVHKFLEQF